MNNLPRRCGTSPTCPGRAEPPVLHAQAAQNLPFCTLKCPHAKASCLPSCTTSISAYPCNADLLVLHALGRAEPLVLHSQALWNFMHAQAQQKSLFCEP
jgi:hypothetical protein